ncbi:hypothetical protein [Chryseobacterium sp. SIMBA_029]|uniref:hypothetical protein n=1 Tax=Chryseobacterium sp. SIMBA_029 TaxID=3085772 RepID=UPI003977EEBD
MKNRLILSTALLLIGFSDIYSQVGVNTAMPKATFDVVGSPTDATKTDGFIAPRLTGNELKVKDALYLTPQTGTVVYITQAASPTTIKTAKVTDAGYYYFDGSIWQDFTGPNIYNSDGTLQANRTVTMGTNTLQFKNGSNSIGLNNNGTQSTLSASGSSTGYIRAQGGGATLDMFVTDSNAAQIMSGGTATKLFVGTHNAEPINFVTNGSIKSTILATGEMGLGTSATTPTEKLDVTSGNLRVRDINTNSSTNNADRVVVADANGVLKTTVLFIPSTALLGFRTTTSGNISADTFRTISMDTNPLLSGMTYNSSTGQYTVTAAGYYQITAAVSADISMNRPTTGGTAQFALRVNGTVVNKVNDGYANGSIITTQNMSYMVYLDVNDVLDLRYAYTRVSKITGGQISAIRMSN